MVASNVSADGQICVLFLSIQNASEMYLLNDGISFTK